MGASEAGVQFCCLLISYAFSPIYVIPFEECFSFASDSHMHGMESTFLFSLTSISGNMGLNSGVILLKMLFDFSTFWWRKIFGSKEVRVIRLASLSLNVLSFESLIAVLFSMRSWGPPHMKCLRHWEWPWNIQRVITYRRWNEGAGLLFVVCVQRTALWYGEVEG